MAKKVLKKKKKQKSKSKKQRHKAKNNKSSKYLLLGVLFISIALIIFILYRGIITSNNLANSDKYFVKGVDVSHHNHILNWQTVIEQNISFAYLKATEGTTLEDRNYLYNYERAKKVNIRVGAYHFYSFGVSGKEQANHFIQTAKTTTGDLLPAIDVEHSPSNPYSTDTSYVALVLNELKVLENELYEYYGVHPLIYTNKDCYKLYIKDRFPDNYIWMCDLDNEPSDDINWKIWQYTHTGELPGGVGHIDFNYYRYSFDEFGELLLP